MPNSFESREIPKPHLSEPTADAKDSYLEAVKEFGAAHEWTEGEVKSAERNIDKLIETTKQDDEESHGRGGPIEQSTFWMVEGDKYIGTLRLRNKLDERVRDVLGNIGYVIRPSERKKGYATQILMMGLEKARESGMPEVIITCDEGNVGSQKVIEANGGELFESNVVTEGRKVPIRRYKISLVPQKDDG